MRRPRLWRVFGKLPALFFRPITELEIDEKGRDNDRLALENTAINQLKNNLRSANCYAAIKKWKPKKTVIIGAFP